MYMYMLSVGEHTTLQADSNVAWIYCLIQLTCNIELTDATTVFVAAHATTFNVHCKLVTTTNNEVISSL